VDLANDFGSEIREGRCKGKTRKWKKDKAGMHSVMTAIFKENRKPMARYPCRFPCANKESGAARNASRGSNCPSS
jgi:hypothetical protein